MDGMRILSIKAGTSGIRHTKTETRFSPPDRPCPDQSQIPCREEKNAVL